MAVTAGQRSPPLSWPALAFPDPQILAAGAELLRAAAQGPQRPGNSREPVSSQLSCGCSRWSWQLSGLS